MNVIIPEPTRKTLRTLDKKTRELIGTEIRKWQNDLPVDLKKLKTEKILFALLLENGASCLKPALRMARRSSMQPK